MISVQKAGILHEWSLGEVSLSVASSNISLSSFMHIVQPHSKTELAELCEVWLKWLTKINNARTSCLLKVTVHCSKAIQAVKI